MALGARLKELRLKKAESLKQVAEAVGVSKAHIWDLEIGNSKNPSMDLLTNLANHFETSVSALAGEDPAELEDPKLVAMFRDVKTLGEKERDMILAMVKTIKKQSDK